MAKFRIEFQITLLAVIIASAVIATGYLAYKSLSQIVTSAQQQASPDYQLFLIKDIAADLAAVENAVRLYVLTDNKKNLAPHREASEAVTKKLENLKKNTSQEYQSLVDSFYVLSVEKLGIWQEVLNLHNSVKGMEPVFTELYSKLERQESDTIITETQTRKKGFLKGIFGKKKVVIDTTIVEKNIEKAELKNEIQNLESTIKEKDTRINILESKLIERNGEIGKELNRLIQWGENFETEERISKTMEAHRLAQMTYKYLAMFSAAAVVLLLAVIFLLFSYQKKSRVYQQALKRAKQEAEKLALAKEQFAANVSHEMRTPVNAIFSLSEQLHQQVSDDPIKKQLAILSHSANHLKSIINDTLDFSKIQAKKLSFDSIHFSPSAVFEEVASIQGIEARKKGISLHYSQVSSLPEALKGDPLRLKQILINLVGNAIKFTEKGEVELSVKTENNTGNKVLLHFQVRDSGIGISEKNLEIIFDEFVQAENEGGKKYSGTGLGLAIVKKLVEMQGGRISVESKTGKGTTLFVSIPYPLGDAGKIEHREFATPDIPEHFRRCSVLIADDDEFNRFVLINILKKWGTKYGEATDGEEAVSVALSGHFDVMLMDMRMPRKSGLDAAKEILAEKPTSKIIAVTASDRKVDQQACLEAGMSGFLMKPFSEKELFDAVSPFLNTSHSEENKQVNQKIKPDDLERIANGDPVFLREMILLFIKTSKDGLNNIHDAVAQRNWEAVSEAAHKMAAPSKHLHAFGLYEKLKRLETEPQNSPNPEIIEELYRSVKKETDEVVASLKHYLETHNAT